MQLQRAAVAMGVVGVVALLASESARPGIAPSKPSHLRPQRDVDTPAEPSPGATTGSERCAAPDVRPTYLPWLKPGEEIPPPRESYDEEIDRAQLSWDDPDSEAGVGLTVYPVPGGVSGAGGPTDIELYGVGGRLHRLDEGGVVSINWILPDRCNFLELGLYAPGLPVIEAVEQLKAIARSLR